jgi:hypothetical protein
MFPCQSWKGIAYHRLLLDVRDPGGPSYKEVSYLLAEYDFCLKGFRGYGNFSLWWLSVLSDLTRI